MQKNNTFLILLLAIIVILVGAVFYLLGKQSASNDYSTDKIVYEQRVESEQPAVGSGQNQGEDKVSLDGETSEGENNQSDSKEDAPASPQTEEKDEANAPTPPANEQTDDNQLQPGECLTNDDCSQGEYCSKKIDQACEGIGVCQKIPELCSLNIDYVCGCDNKTHNNVCFAAKNGVNIKAKGKCSLDVKGIKLSP